MNVYLPIAEMSVNIFLILGLGGAAGILAGIFGIGGGFLITPFLIFIGVPPSISVSTVANQIIATSVSGFIAHWRRGNVDFKMGWFLFAGGVVGSSIGGWLPTLWGGSAFSFSSVILSALGGFAGIWVGYKLGE